METRSVTQQNLNDYYTKLGQRIKEKLEGFESTVQANFERKLTDCNSQNLSKRDIRFMIIHPHVLNSKKL